MVSTGATLEAGTGVHSLFEVLFTFHLRCWFPVILKVTYQMVLAGRSRSFPGPLTQDAARPGHLRLRSYASGCCPEIQLVPTNAVLQPQSAQFNFPRRSYTT